MSGANQPRLYVHSLESERLGDGLGYRLAGSVLRSLSMRAILLSQPGDVVIVDRLPDSNWLDYLVSVGIVHGTIQIARGNGETIIDRMLGDEELLSGLRGEFELIEPYMGSDQVQRLAKALGMRANAPPAHLLNRINLKSNLCPILEHAGLPTISTTVCSRDNTLSTAKHMLHEYGSVMVRSDLSIGGLGVWAIKRPADLDALLNGIEQADSSRLFVLQPLLDVTSSPNAQYEIKADGPRFLGISSQTMTQNYAFGGNEFPCLECDDRIRSQSDTIALWLFDAGYRGMVGIDFIISPGQGVFIVEINPRVNTSTFPLLLSDRLGTRSFRLTTGISTSSIGGFSQLQLAVGAEKLYDPSRASGVVPLLAPSLNRPVLDAMVFGDNPKQVAELSTVLIQELEIISTDVAVVREST